MALENEHLVGVDRDGDSHEELPGAAFELLATGDPPKRDRIQVDADNRDVCTVRATAPKHPHVCQRDCLRSPESTLTLNGLISALARSIDAASRSWRSLIGNRDLLA